jgi:hypothetical protein
MTAIMGRGGPTRSNRAVSRAPHDTTRGRLGRERRTLAAMIAIYCRDQHGGRYRALCDECESLRRYAQERLALCPFGPQKPTCVNCAVHCYRPEPRERVREVMRHAGPRMLLRHPVLAALHLLLDSRREARSTRPRPEPAAAPAQSPPGTVWSRQKRPGPPGVLRPASSTSGRA